METAIKRSFGKNALIKGKSKINKKSIAKFLKDAEFNRLGITSLLLLGMACMGGIAAASGIMHSWVKLALVAFPSTISLAMILSVAPMRVIFITTAIALILDILVIFF